MNNERKAMIAAWGVVLFSLVCGWLAYKLTVIAYTWLLPHISH